jgi:uncharacterized protein YoaH (UPF0181 family)
MDGENREKQVDKIKKLLALSASSNENEAAAALAKAMRLCAENDMSVEDFEAGDEIVDDIAIDFRAQIPKWNVYLYSELSDIFGCRIVYSYRRLWGGRAKTAVKFVGFSKDVEILTYISSYLVGEIKKLSSSHFKRLRQSYFDGDDSYYDNPSAYKKSYLIGMAMSVTDKAKEVFKANQSESVSAGYALVLKRGGLVDKWLSEKNLKMRKSRKTGIDELALLKGHEDGKSIAIRQGMNQGQEGRTAVLTA